MKKSGSKNVNHHTFSLPVVPSELAAPVWTGGAGGGPAVVSAGAGELGVALVVRVYRTEEPAAVGRVATDVARDEVVGTAVDEVEIGDSMLVGVAVGVALRGVVST